MLKVRTLLLIILSIFALAVFAQQRMGTFVDEVIVVMEPTSEAAIRRMEAGEFDVYAMTLSSPDLFRRVRESPILGYEVSYGSYNELTFNPVGPTFPDGRLNPFSVPAIREAMNWLVDRNYIVREILGGLALPRFFPINSVSADYVELIDVVRALENKYQYNFQRAEKVITEEMLKLGAQKVGGLWTYKGQPVEIILLIRIEDERKQIGDYVADQLEKLGFKTIRDYKRAAEASPIWLSGNPADGKFHIYTGGWITTAVPRDLTGNLDYFYTPRGRPNPLWQAYKPSEEFDRICEMLANKEFTSTQERRELFAKGLELSLQDSVRIWTNDNMSFVPKLKNVLVTADLYGGISGSWLWPYTIRFENKVGGTMRIGLPSGLTDPWNAIAGSNWIFDMMLIRSTGAMAYMPDPYTGLYYPYSFEKAEVTIKAGLPVRKTLDWVELKFEPEIVVPPDAFIDWDAKEQRFITVAEKHGDQKLTALRKITVQYPKDLYDRKMHDGSTFDAADLIFKMILTFDRANKDSPFFDESAVPAFTSFLKVFKGFRIVSTNPFIAEYYTDLWYPDAEWNAGTGANVFWPYYDQGPAPWHVLAVGFYAEMQGKAAFSSAKAKKLNVEWLNYVAGPTIPVLKASIDEMIAKGWIPYEKVLTQYVPKEKLLSKYQNLLRWYNQKGHFWVAWGPLYLEKAFPIEKVVQLKRFEQYPFPVERWAGFQAAPVPQVMIEGPSAIRIGETAAFDLFIEFEGQPYPASDISGAVYLLFSPEGTLLLKGNAEPLTDGWFAFEIPADSTKSLTPGVYKLEVAVTSIKTALPGMGAIDVVVRGR